MIKFTIEIIREYGFKNLLHWDILLSLIIGVIVYLFIGSLDRKQIITFLGPSIGACASLVAVQISAIALLISLIQKETAIMLAPDNNEERNLILALGGPFLIGTISWVGGVLLLLTSFLIVLKEYSCVSRVIIAIGVGFVTYSIVLIPNLIAFIIHLLSDQAQFLKRRCDEYHEHRN